MRGFRMIRASLIIAVATLSIPAAAQQELGSPELIAAAKQEGRLVLYTANFAEVEQEVINAFNKRFPEIRIEMVRAPGGLLITASGPRSRRTGSRPTSSTIPTAR